MRLSVVLPLFDEAENLVPLYDRLSATMDRIACDYELIFVDDGSTDDSLRVLERLSERDDRVKFLSLTRNFGHEAASTAGLDIADGDAVVLMDADLQDPPELIDEMLERWVQGSDVVYARRVRREGETPFKRMAAFLFYRLMRRASALDLPLDTGDFRLMDRRVVEAFRQLPERQRFVRGLLTWLGFRQTAVDYVRPARHAGSGKYSVWSLCKLSLDAVLGFSIVPLRAVAAIGLVSIAAAGVVAAVAFARTILLDIPITDGRLTQLCVALFAGVQLVTIGILGEYIGRIHGEVQRRPLYLIDRQRGWSAAAGRRDYQTHDRRRHRPRRHSAMVETDSTSALASYAPQPDRSAAE
jgi:dolichol-phosphate mannosyltransferase